MMRLARSFVLALLIGLSVVVGVGAEDPTATDTVVPTATVTATATPTPLPTLGNDTGVLPAAVATEAYGRWPFAAVNEALSVYDQLLGYPTPDNPIALPITFSISEIVPDVSEAASPTGVTNDVWEWVTLPNGVGCWKWSTGPAPVIGVGGTWYGYDKSWFIESVGTIGQDPYSAGGGQCRVGVIVWRPPGSCSYPLQLQWASETSALDQRHNSSEWRVTVPSNASDDWSSYTVYLNCNTSGGDIVSVAAGPSEVSGSYIPGCDVYIQGEDGLLASSPWTSPVWSVVCDGSPWIGPETTPVAVPTVDQPYTWSPFPDDVAFEMPYVDGVATWTRLLSRWGFAVMLMVWALGLGRAFVGLARGASAVAGGDGGGGGKGDGRPS